MLYSILKEALGCCVLEAVVMTPKLQDPGIVCLLLACSNRHITGCWGSEGTRFASELELLLSEMPVRSIFSG